MQIATPGARLPPAVRRASSFFLLGFLIVGLPRLYTNTVAFTLFLQHWDALLIPVTYLGAALAVPLGGLLWMWLQSRLALRVLLPLAVAFDLLIDIVVCLLLESFANDPLVGRWLSMALAVWVEVEWALVSLVFWGLAEQVFRLREAKGIFGLIAGGEPLAVVLGGLSVPLLLQYVQVASLLWVSVAALACGLLTLVWLLRQEHERLGEEDDDAIGDAPVVSDRSPRSLRGYLTILFALVVFGELVHLVLDTAFFVGLEARLSDASEVAGFLGVFFAAVGVGSLVGNLFASGWLLRRFGVVAAIIGLPALVVLLAGAGLASGLGNGNAPLLFVFVLAAKMAEEAGHAGLFQPAFLVFYQPLPANTRLRVQALAESVFQPLAAGITGAGLLALAAYDSGSMLSLLALAGGLALVWLALAWVGWRGYLRTLASAVARRRLQTNIGTDDADTRGVLRRALASPQPADVVYALRTLEHDLGDPLWAPIDTLLRHPDQDVRMEVLGLLERQRAEGFESTLLERLRLTEVRGAERGATLRALASVADTRARPHLIAALRGGDAEARDGALEALMHHGGIEGVLSAGSHLQALLRSPDAGQRVAAAGIIGRLGLPALARHLRELILDHEPAVRRTAVRAAAGAPAPSLVAPLLAQIAVPRLASPACNALVAIGVPAIPGLAALYRSSTSNRRVRRHILDTLGKIGGERAMDLLRKESATAEPRLALRAARALYRCDASSEENIGPAQVDHTLGGAQDLLNLLRIAPLQGEKGALLRGALEDDLACARERLMLALLREHRQAHTAGLVRDLCGRDPSRRAYALELLESRLPRARRALVAALLEEQTPPTGLAMDTRAFLEALNDGEGVSSWTRACAAAAVSISRAPPSDKGDHAVMPVIERVMVMRSVTLFADVPGELLAELAEVTDEVEVTAGTTIIHEGETGSTLYVVVDGQVEVTRGGSRLAVIGARDVFGELAALDPEPRSASVTALEDVRLLRLAQEHLEALMTDDVEFMRGILRTLCRRLRAVAISH